MSTIKENLRAEIERVGREKFGFQHLSPAQLEVITSVVQGRDTLAVMPTGSGKSATYQIAGLILGGPTVVVSPLLALQRDQVRSLEEHGIGEAAAMNSSVGRRDREEAMEEFEEDELDFLFTAPEQFHNEETLERLSAAKPSLFVIDEAHCITEWGEDFRPDYLRLGAVIESLGRPTVLALTATASSRVRQEIVERLGLHDPAIVVQDFDRPNIWLGVEHFHDEVVKKRELITAVSEAENRQAFGGIPGIVYVSTHKHAEELAALLNEEGVKALAYHAGMKAADRTKAEQAFMGDEVEVMVATTAFGMGIDKPNVRFVFHYDVPDSLDTYYQEIGRAGRDGEPARALLFYRPEDLGIHRFFAGTGKVNEEQVERVATTIKEHDGPIDAHELQAETDLSRAKLTTALSRLEETGAVDILATGEVVEGEERQDSEQVVREALTAEEHRRAVDQSRLEMMRGYAEALDCRRGYLLSYFGEQFTVPCGNCDNCQAGVVTTDEADHPFEVGSRVSHGAFGTGEVQRYDGDKIVVLFDDVGYKELLTEFVQETGALQSA